VFILVIGFLLVIPENGFTSPLLFKTTKEVTTTAIVELGSFDSTRFRQLRIVVQLTNKPKARQAISKDSTLTELNASKRELRRSEELLQQGVISRSDYDQSAERLKIAQANYDNALEIVFPPIMILGLEGNEEIPLVSFDGESSTNSIVIDSPPSRIRVNVFGKGTYKLFVWASV